MDEKQEKQNRRKMDWNIRPYLAIGLTALIVIVLGISFFFLIYRYNGLANYGGMLMGILQPILIGLVLAYLINPIVKMEERHLLPFLEKHMKKGEKAKKVSRGVSVIGALLFVIVVVALLLSMVIPQLYKSIEGMVVQLPRQAKVFIEWAEGYLSTDSEISEYLEAGLNGLIGYFENWVKSDLLPQMQGMLYSLTNGVISFVKVVINVVVGVIISVYVLMGKETFVGQAKKAVYALLPTAKGNVLIEVVRKANEIFGGFISGKILDSAIIGVICFIGLYLMRTPYAVLVSVIVGVTNVIPFFGPYIGAIPSAILILLADPLKGLYFIIFIFILQQVDGNIIGPRILGESTGLSSFWVVFAILVGGGLFGFFGMVLGVPVFATIYYLLQRLFAHILRMRGLPVGSGSYTDVERVDPKTKKLEYDKENNEE